MYWGIQTLLISILPFLLYINYTHTLSFYLIISHFSLLSFILLFLVGNRWNRLSTIQSNHRWDFTPCFDAVVICLSVHILSVIIILYCYIKLYTTPSGQYTAFILTKTIRVQLVHYMPGVCVTQTYYFTDTALGSGNKPFCLAAECIACHHLQLFWKRLWTDPTPLNMPLLLL